MKDILAFTPAEIAALSNEELEALCSVFFPVTRPSKVQLNKANVNSVLKKAGLDPKKFKVATLKVKSLEEKTREDFIKKYGEDSGKIFFDAWLKAKNEINKGK